MPRRPAVRMNELEDLIDATAVSASNMQECAERILQGYCEKPNKLMAKIMGLNSIIGGASALLGALTQKLYLIEMRTDMDAQFKDRATSQGE